MKSENKRFCKSDRKKYLKKRIEQEKKKKKKMNGNYSNKFKSAATLSSMIDLNIDDCDE